MHVGDKNENSTTARALMNVESLLNFQPESFLKFIEFRYRKPLGLIQEAIPRRLWMSTGQMVEAQLLGVVMKQTHGELVALCTGRITRELWPAQHHPLSPPSSYFNFGLAVSR